MVGGEKGGVGKTTLATHLAVARKAAGRTIVLVDADSQGTSSTWSDARKEKKVPQLPCVSLRGGKVHVELKELARHYEDVVIGGFTFLTLVLSAELWACRDGGRE